MSVPLSTTQAIRMIENDGYFRLSFPILKWPLRIVLFGTLSVFWSVILVAQGPSVGLLLLFLLTSYLALIIGLNSSRLTLRNGLLTGGLGPVLVPGSNCSLNAGDIQTIEFISFTGTWSMASSLGPIPLHDYIEPVVVVGDQ